MVWVDRYLSDRSEEIADRQSKEEAMVSELFSLSHIDYYSRKPSCPFTYALE